MAENDWINQMMSLEFSKTQTKIENFAKANHHEYILTEHLLWGLTDNPSAKEVLLALDIHVDELRLHMESYLKMFATTTNQSNYRPIPSQAVGRVLRHAVFHLQSSEQDRGVEGTDVLVAMFAEQNSYAVRHLKSLGLERIHLLRYLSHHKLNRNAGNDKINDGKANGTDDNPYQSRTKKAKDPLALYTENLNERAKTGQIDPLVGRQAEIRRVAQILARRRKNNPLLVGDTGVGKTAIAEGLAWLIVHGNIFDVLKDVVIYRLDLAALVAGAKYRGDFEDRIKMLLQAVKKQEHAVLFIDEIHTMIGAGASTDGTMDASNLLKPALANGELRCIGSTTFAEFRQIFESDGALSRRFQKVDVAEPSIEDAVAILEGLKSRYQDFHCVIYPKESIEAMVSLSVKYINGRFLPDKAIDVMDEVGARQNLARPKDDVDTQDKTTQEAVSADKPKRMPITITLPMIEEVVASMARIPQKSVSKDDLSLLKTLDVSLKQVVFGQDEAVERLVDAIKMARVGLKPAEKPIGSFLFAGPTGVGKTEISRQLAYLLGIPLLRFDMSEYMEAYTASRLIGSPPGYVGHDKGGLLTEKVQQNPHCVLLLDELEKAHDDVFNLLLQVMDHGTLTDSNGRVVSFRQAIIIMTTNVGADALNRRPIGFITPDISRNHEEELKRVFSPEFRNRLDAIVHFAPLSERSIAAVVDKFLASLQVLLDDKGVTLNVSDNARHYLANKGYDVQMGARPMARLIDYELKKPLSNLLLFGDLADGGMVAVDVADDKLTLTVCD